MEESKRERNQFDSDACSWQYFKFSVTIFPFRPVHAPYVTETTQYPHLSGWQPWKLDTKNLKRVSLCPGLGSHIWKFIMIELSHIHASVTLFHCSCNLIKIIVFSSFRLDSLIKRLERKRERRITMWSTVSFLVLT